MSIHLKRAYEHPARADGYRILVDRLWPHGVSKAELQFDIWAKDLAPSAGLRTWFDHDPGKWEEFKRRYFHELDAHRAAVEPILSLLSRATVTLVFAAKDRLFNNAVALKEYLEKLSGQGAKAEGGPRTWPEVRAWRRARRAELLERRRAMARADKRAVEREVIRRLKAGVPDLANHEIGLYWPIKGEIDVRPAVPKAARLSLPVVVAERAPLEFWAWKPGTRMARGFWNIPVPAEREPVRPTALLVPLLGFDAAGYRLGYGGGYYDRTLAALDPRPLTIGLGCEAALLETIHPQPHDIPMDVIVTEKGIRWFRSSAKASKVRRGHGESARLH